jgi:hypothetical protein
MWDATVFTKNRDRLLGGDFSVTFTLCVDCPFQSVVTHRSAAGAFAVFLEG